MWRTEKPFYLLFSWKSTNSHYEAETPWGNSKARQKSFILPYKEEIVPNSLRVRNTDRDTYVLILNSLSYLIWIVYLCHFRHPVQYHNANAGRNTATQAMLWYIVPSVLLSILVCVPKFLEIRPFHGKYISVDNVS